METRRRVRIVCFLLPSLRAVLEVERMTLKFQRIGSGHAPPAPPCFHGGLGKISDIIFCHLNLGRLAEVEEEFC